MRNDLEKVEKKIKTSFKNKTLLLKALTHKSYANLHGIENNERLEFLGDSILNLIVSDFLYKKFPLANEGELTKMKSTLVNRENLCSWARNIEFEKFIFLSEEEEASGGRKRPSILANTFEAIVGAIYEDAGFDKAKEFVVNQVKKQKDLEPKDYKSAFQEVIQDRYKILPQYIVRSELGPNHKKTFEIEAKVKDKVLGKGKGKSKKEAEQKAAQQALKNIKKKI